MTTPNLKNVPKLNQMEGHTNKLLKIQKSALEISAIQKW